MEAVITLILVGILLALTVAANMALHERERTFHFLVVIALALVNAILVLLGVLFIVIGISPDFAEAALETDIDRGSALLGGAFFALTGVLASLLLLERVRVSMTGWFPRLRQPEQFVAMSSPSPFQGLVMGADGSIIPMPPTLPEPTRRLVYRGELRGFDPHNTVHMLAMILCVYLIGSQIANFVISGGISGYAESAGITWSSLILNFIPMVLIPLVGAGLFMRRGLGEVFERLGFHRLTIESIGVSVGLAFVAFMFQLVIGIIWFNLLPPEVVEEQTEASRAIADSIDTIWLVLAVSFTASVGEEIAFRGALQPIFGLWWTAILFTLVHIQYTLTPATLIIFGVALGLGWVRRRYNLYAAIVTHFLYNFVQLLLALLFR